MRTVGKDHLASRLRAWISASDGSLIRITVNAALEIADALEGKETPEHKLKEATTRAVEFFRASDACMRSWGCKNCGLNFSVDSNLPIQPIACPYCRMKIGEFVPSLIHDSPEPKP